MIFFLRNISISVLVLAILVGGAAVYLSGRIAYETMLNQVFSERILIFETLGSIALEDETDEISFDGTELIATTTENRDISLQTTLEDIAENSNGILFLRVIDTRSRFILESADPLERGSIATEDIPESIRGEVAVALSRNNEREIVELTYLGTNDRLLWMAIDQSFFINPAIILGIEQALLLVAAFGLFAFLFYAIIRRFFMRPVRQLKHVLSSVEEEAANADRRESFGELLGSFSDVAQRIESTIEHDKVISETKSDFISTTAHQLRTPLSGINWALGALLSEGQNLTEEQRTMLDRALEKTKELVMIVGELLSAAGIEQGKFGFHREEVSLKEEIEQTIAEEKQTAEKNKITLQFEYADEEFPKVYVDRERIRWVVRNLIENAIRYGKEGGAVVTSLKKDRKRLTVSVKDDGIGISPQAQQHMFEKFFRSPEAKKKRNDGSGLGLFIVKNIVNYHGGRIWFESVEGVGTTFFFTIPVARGVASESKT